MKSPRGIGVAMRIALVVVLIVGLAVAYRFLPVAAWLGGFQVWVRSFGAFGYLVFAVVYAAACVLFIPASILTLAAGAIYGVAAGSAVVLVGATAGATASFLLARTILRERVAAWVGRNRKLDALDRAVGKEGSKIVLLVRLAPVFPFTYMNYAFGLTRIATVPYVAATVVGMLPATVAFVFLGSAAANAATAQVSRTRTIIQIAGAVLAVVATAFASRVAARAIRKAGGVP